MNNEDKKMLNDIADRLDWQYDHPNNEVRITLKYCSKALRDLVKKLNISVVVGQSEQLFCQGVIHHSCKHFSQITGCDKCKVKKFKAK
jgi:hypothetical protein